ncbi:MULTISPECIES: hypothetical protein [Pseudanabaena]|uniref:O-GlcNAc transferase C-terminal domain-containing protein n=2 Tax=Pseudanabaena TaxID=1152 RepID=L8N2Y4_9CYAN|nr:MULTISPECIES: hypothetical protein [Pseudanabaena]ELS34597.1 hypothetical protein Pse7429DRAFT_0311 [Pseudanabaena biceps PCC 7429]MDG3493202.1 hypothetical protein [Pseudanabaena catenata USMAC16]
MNPQNSTNLSFNSLEILKDYLNQDYDLVSEKLIYILEHFERTTYLELAPDAQHFINAFVKNFLYVFTQPDYCLSDRYAIRFIQLNLTISNLVAISCFKTTDDYLDLLTAQPQDLAKILTLCSARNSWQCDRQVLFDTNPALTSLWYSHYLEIYRSGLVNAIAYKNLREHILYEDARLTGFYKIDDVYFGSTYIDGDDDRLLKARINKLVQNSQLVKDINISNQPTPTKIAIISGFWYPQHSIYRILSECIAALKDSYELTLIHIGDQKLAIDTQYFKEVKYLRFDNGLSDLSVIKQNEFAAIYYPDIGMMSESIILSNLRIAPIQICGLGHPVSTFGSEIDYFISGADAEDGRHAEDNYSERLVLVTGLGAVNNRPDYQLLKDINSDNAIQTSIKSSDQFIINCPWYAQKVNYPLLLTLKKVIQNAKSPVLFRLFSGGALTRKNDFLPFAKDVEEVLGSAHVHIYPYMPYAEYMAIMEEGDICLDSYHFGGFNVLIDGLYLQKPSVVFEGKRWYSRSGAALMKKLGLGELVVKTPSAYSQLTLKLIGDRHFYELMQDKVRQIDLQNIAFQPMNGQYFKKAIDFLIQNHDHLKSESSKKAIRIS